MNSFLPLTDCEAPGRKEASPPGEGIASREVRVLIVEDDDRLRRLSCRFLAARGWTILEAQDSREGLRLVEEAGRVPDVIITDVVLPDGSGPEWIAQARTRHPGIAVLFVSGYAPPEDDEAASLLQHGVWLQKPYSFERLIREVESLLPRHQA